MFIIIYHQIYTSKLVLFKTFNLILIQLYMNTLFKVLLCHKLHNVYFNFNLKKCNLDNPKSYLKFYLLSLYFLLFIFFLKFMESYQLLLQFLHFLPLLKLISKLHKNIPYYIIFLNILTEIKKVKKEANISRRDKCEK